jgi:hypothetical protein
MKGKVSIGFANSRGEVKTTIIEEDYTIIERINLKPRFLEPKLKLRQIDNH